MNKLINITVLPKGRAQEFTCDQPWAAISVSTDPSSFAKLSAENRLGLLQVSFWDIDQKNQHNGVNVEFTTEQAKDILTFVQDMLPSIDSLLVHCEAGMSRSPAIAAAISNILWGSNADQVYFKKYTPNFFVYRKLLEAYYGGCTIGTV